ncbi:leucyl aminopeptidase [Pseudonocardia eucalypti]|uniref:leucyl aminopeptidase family protein n=1 Tax=Pseudonocardia eucalypti TaxID=648755 RepID=UPI0017E6D06E|nr:leucyl aminopeptidase [Pseudonocardia eucalypti]
MTAATGPDPGAPRVVTLDEQGNQRGWPAEPVASELITLLGATGKPGELHRLPDGSWLLGIGDGADEGGLRHAGATLSAGMGARADRTEASSAEGVSDAGRASLDASGMSEAARVALAVGLILGSHRFKVTRKQPPPPGEVLLVVPAGELAAAGEQLARASALAGATALARDLASAPSDVKSPTWLVETAAALAEDVPGLAASVRPHEWLVANGFGGMLAVGGGSSRPPALLRLTWTPPGATKHLVLVGKGITFDTGGISIKPADGMHLMRTDMAGGAAVIGAMLAIARLELPIKVTGLVPAAENHVSGSAYRPGDVVRHYDGQTTEVTNTDAEGRMVLADAIGYAVRELEPDLIVDVATLTGAMKVSLGLRTGGLFATDDPLAEALLAAGERTGEQLWRMPLLDHVAEEVPSDIADLRQIPKGPSGIGAALFLRAFTAGLPWAHLDIAGPARCEKPYREVAAGATGFAARTLTVLAEAMSAG